MTGTDSGLPKLNNAKHLAYAEAYLTNGFKREPAAATAGYSGKRLRQTANDLMKRDDVKAYIAARMKQLQMSADEALLRLGGHASGNITEFIGLTIDELKTHPRAALIKKVKFVTHFPEPVIIEPDENDPDGAVTIDQPKPIQLVESIELYDAQAAMRDVIKQSQLASGQATDTLNIPQLAELMELLTAAGKDPTSVISRMVDKLKSEANKP